MRGGKANLSYYERILSKSHTENNSLTASRFTLEGVEKNKVPGLETIEDDVREDDAMTYAT